MRLRPTNGRRGSARPDLKTVSVDSRKPLFSLRKINPSTDMHRVVPRRRASGAHQGEFGRLPHSGFRRNVNGPEGHGGAENQGRPWKSSEPARSPTWRFGRSSDRNGRQAGSRLRPFPISGSDKDGEPDRDRWTARTPGFAERRRPGARQDTADRPFRFACDGAQAEVQTRTAKSNPDLARGRRARVRPDASSPRSIPAPLCGVCPRRLPNAVIRP